MKIDRLTKIAELRLKGIDESITPLEITAAVTEIGGCEIEEVRVGDKRMSPAGVETAWLKCPLSAANRIVAVERMQIGWALVTVQLLDNRPLQCYKCLEGDRVRQRCPNDVDKNRQCYRCGSIEHEARNCGERIQCPV